MNDLNPPITGQAAKMTTTKVDDNTTIVCTVHLNASPVFAECCAVARDGTQRRIGKSPSGYRIDSASAEAFSDGTVRLWLSCWPDNQSGTEASIRYLDFPDALQPSAPAAGGACVDQAARDQANYATKLATSANSNASAAVNQANSATNMAHNALNANTAQDEKIADLETRTAALEGA